jgi:hypothetical protein
LATSPATRRGSPRPYPNGTTRKPSGGASGTRSSVSPAREGAVERSAAWSSSTLNFSYIDVETLEEKFISVPERWPSRSSSRWSSWAA